MSVPSNLVPVTISNLPTAGPITGTELTVIVQDGYTKRTTISDFVGGVSVPSSRTIAAGTGLGGGGNLTQDRVIYIEDTGVVSGTYGSATQVPILTVNAQGQITSISVTSFSVAFANITGKPTTLAGYGITDAQPLNNNLTAIASVGTTGFLTFTASGAVSTRTITAGTGINVNNGDGISGNPEVVLQDTAVTPGLYGGAGDIPVITIDQQGRITSAGQTTATVTWSNVSGTPTTLAGYGITDAVPNTRTVTGQYSIIGGGALSSNLQFSLDGDTNSPGASQYYGTDSTGTKGWWTLSAGGTVTQINTGTGLTGGPITTTGTISIANTGVTAAIYGSASTVPRITVNAQGQITLASSVSIEIDASQITSGILPVSYGGTGASTLTGYVKGNGTSAFTASTTIPNTDITGLGTMSTQNANNVTITGGSATLTSIAVTSGTITNSPSGNTDIANKAYVDSVAQGLNVKQSVLWGTTGNITLSGLGTQSGGEWTGTLTAGDRILVKNQLTAADNGIYAASSSGWTRTADANSWDELVSAFVFIQDGATLADTGWVCTVNPGGTLGVTAVTWSQFSGAGTYTAGTGLTLSGNQFSITNTGVTANSYGSASSVPTFTVNAQGQLTLASNTSIAIAASQITSGTISSSLISGSYTGITGVGTLTAGTWNANTIGIGYGGTGQTTASAAFNALSPITSVGDLIIGNGTNSATRLGIGANGYVLTSDGTTASWQPAGSVSAVTSISFGTTGLTPATATTGAVTVAGTLVVANGGTGATTASGARTNLGAAASGANSDITSMSGLTGGISTPTFVQFDTAATYARGTGKLMWDSGTGTLAFGIDGGSLDLPIGQSNVVLVKNDDTTSIAAGDVVYISGANGTNILVKKALATSDATSADSLGVAMQSIATNATGYICTFGIVHGLNTNSYNAGDTLYLSYTTPGGWTATKPEAPYHLVVVGYVTKKSAGNGEVFVSINNGWELNELHNVLITSQTTGDILTYDGSVPAWVNYAAGSQYYSLVSNGAATKPTWQQISLTAGVTGTLPAANGGTGQSSYTIGDLLYASGTAALSKLAAGTANYALVSNGAGSAPSYQQISLTAGVTGTLPITNGGTGQTTASAAFNALSPITSTGDLIIGNGVNSATRLAIGTNGYVLTSNGTTASWQAIAATGVTSISFGTTGLTPSTTTTGAVTVAGTLAITNGGTGATTVAAAQTNLQVDPAGTAVAMAIALG